MPGSLRTQAERCRAQEETGEENTSQVKKKMNCRNKKNVVQNVYSRNISTGLNGPRNWFLCDCSFVARRLMVERALKINLCSFPRRAIIVAWKRHEAARKYSQESHFEVLPLAGLPNAAQTTTSFIAARPVRNNERERNSFGSRTL